MLSTHTCCSWRPGDSNNFGVGAPSLAMVETYMSWGINVALRGASADTSLYESGPSLQASHIQQNVWGDNDRERKA